MSREIADENWDFRDGIDEKFDGNEEDFRLDFSEKPKKNAGTRLTREQVNAKKATRLPSHLRAYLILEIISTNKTGVAIARKFGVTPQNVYRLKAGIVRELLASKTKILYRKNGELFFK